MDIYRLRRQMLHEILNQPTLRIHVEQRRSNLRLVRSILRRCILVRLFFLIHQKLPFCCRREAKKKHPEYFEPLYTHLASERRIGTVEQEERQ